MLLSISLQNWRSHENTTLEFKKGTNLLIGIMGSGKSSILDAICFALFGTFPSLERRKQSLSDIFRLNENRASITLKFLWDNSIYSIERKIERKKDSVSSDAEIRRDSKLMEKGPTAVTNYVEQLLHVDYDLFTRAIYSEQNNIDYFLTLDPRKRKQEMDVLLGLDKFEDARANCTTLFNRVRSNRTSVEAKFNKGALDDARKRENEISERLVSLHNSEKEISGRIEDSRAGLVALESEFALLKNLRVEFQTAEKEKLRFETIVSNLKKELDGKSSSEQDVKVLAEKKLSLEKEKVALVSEFRVIENELSRQNMLLGAMDSKIKSTEKDKTELVAMQKNLEQLLDGKNREEIVADQDATSAELSKLDGEQRFLGSKINELEDSLRRIKPGIGKCPVCDASLDEHKAGQILEEKNAAITSANSRIKEVVLLIAGLKPKLHALQGKLKSMDVSSSKIEDLSKRVVPAESLASDRTILFEKCTALTNARKQLYEKQDSHSSSLQDVVLLYRDKEQVLKKLKELEIANTSLIQTKERLFVMNYSEAAYEEKQKSSELARIGHEKLLAQKTQVISEIKSANELQSVLSKEISTLLGMEKEIVFMVQLEEELAIYKNALLRTQVSLRGELVQSINSAMNEIWGIFYPYRDYKEIRLSITEKDYAFELYDSKWKPLEAVASGGERACAALTLRVALAMVLTPNLSWLILDEPTHNLDREAVELLSQTLQTKVPEVVEQTFVITHDEGLMGSEFASSYKLGRDKGNFESTKVEKI